jgi:uncharacterized membrane protein
MDLEGFEKFWKEWRYGLIEGLLLGIIMMASFFAMMGSSVLNVLILVFVIPMFVVMMNNAFGSKKKPKEATYEGCPECGSTKRHKKTCSRAKK